MKTHRHLLAILFILATLFGHQPAQAASNPMPVKRADLVFKVHSTDLVHIVTIVNQGTSPAIPIIITSKAQAGIPPTIFYPA